MQPNLAKNSQTQPNLLKVANCIHIREKLVQIVLTFLILGIVVIWYHSFTKFTGAGRKCTVTGSLSKLFYFGLYISIYSFSYPISFATGFERPGKQVPQQPLQ
jgi:hypothetical protein